MNTRDDRDRLREALTWAVGFIDCNLPRTATKYPDMRNARDLIDRAGELFTGEFQLTAARAEVAENQRDECKDGIGHALWMIDDIKDRHRDISEEGWAELNAIRHHLCGVLMAVEPVDPPPPQRT